MTRRTLLRGLGLGAASQLLSGLWPAASRVALAGPSGTVAPDYRALVCVFLAGGNDANNMIVPFDPADAVRGYPSYAAVRNPQTCSFSVAQSALIRVDPAGLAVPYGFHPKMPRSAALFAQGRMAVVCNVGTLAAPTTKAQYASPHHPRPSQLFSHPDQQDEWQAAAGGGGGSSSATGWGGRAADSVLAYNASTFPPVIAMSEAPLYAIGASARPLAMPPSATLKLNGSGPSLAYFQQILAIDGPSPIVAADNRATRDAIANGATLTQALVDNAVSWTKAFPDSDIGAALAEVALVIAASGPLGLGLRRQIFYVPMIGFDTHSDQAVTQGTLLGELDEALYAFYQAMAQLGAASKVTTFTSSEFSRTFAPASVTGTDHGWGGHQLVLGGAVQGGAFYGTYPRLSLGGPDDIGQKGRWLPTIPVDRYAATLAKWLGVAANAMTDVLPNLPSFDPAPRDLGFMKP